VARLGQNFLTDRNLLDAILRDAALAPGDVVLEVGTGEGVLTKPLAEAAAHVHTIEIDRRLEETLAPVASRPNVDLHWGDAMKMDLGALHPAPTAVVANLPYSVATPLILRMIEQLPFAEYWTVMVQREIAERLRAGPGSKAYGGPSVLVQIACEAKMLRAVNPAVFKPRPRVESTVLQLRRVAPAASPMVQDFVRAAFAHRRKSMARSANHVQPGVMGVIRSTLETLGMRREVRAEDIPPLAFVRIAECVPWKLTSPQV